MKRIEFHPSIPISCVVLALWFGAVGIAVPGQQSLVEVIRAGEEMNDKTIEQIWRWMVPVFLLFWFPLCGFIGHKMKQWATAPHNQADELQHRTSVPLKVEATAVVCSVLALVAIAAWAIRR